MKGIVYRLVAVIALWITLPISSLFFTILFIRVLVFFGVQYYAPVDVYGSCMSTIFILFLYCYLTSYVLRKIKK